MIYCFDLDNTLLATQGNDYERSKPITEAIAEVNRLASCGHVIKIYTGRGSASGKDWREFTKHQLAQFGVNYHELIMGKPSYDIWVDDHCINVKDWIKTI